MNEKETIKKLSEELELQIKINTILRGNYRRVIDERNELKRLYEELRDDLKK